MRSQGYLRRHLDVVIHDPRKTIMIFPLAAVAAILSVLPGSHWPHSYLVALLSVAGVGVVAVCVRLALGERIPRWSLYVETGVAIVLISVLSALGPRDHVNFASLYIWVVLFVSLYFAPFVAVLYSAAAGAAYVVVLIVGPTVQRPVIAWLATFATATVSCAIVLVLVDLLRTTAREDPLTGLANRRSWDERIHEEVERARRDQRPLSLIVIDIDNFKVVNDHEGHHAGDRLLRHLADGWQAITREGGDFIARIGGDEFGLLAPDSNDTDIQRVVKRLREVSPDGISCSFGVATWNGAETAADLFRRADEMMYHVKRE